jgi:hypothetical protein
VPAVLARRGRRRFDRRRRDRLVEEQGLVRVVLFAARPEQPPQQLVEAGPQLVVLAPLLVQRREQLADHPLTGARCRVATSRGWPARHA